MVLAHPGSTSTHRYWGRYLEPAQAYTRRVGTDCCLARCDEDEAQQLYFTVILQAMKSHFPKPIYIYILRQHLNLELIINWEQMNRRQKPRNPVDALNQLLDLIFNKEFDPKVFFPLQADIAQDSALVEPAAIIFALYSLFIRQEDPATTAMNCVRKVEVQYSDSVGHVIALVIKSAYLAYTKKYKQSIQVLNSAYAMANSPQLHKENVDFYHKVLTKIIEIHDLSTFRRQYLDFVEKILDEHKEKMSHAQSIKALLLRRAELKEKIGIYKPRPKLGPSSNPSRLTLKRKQESSSMSPYQQMGKQRQKSIHSRGSSQSIASRTGKVNTVGSKRTFKKYQYTNPYEFAFDKTDNCAFM